MKKFHIEAIQLWENFSFAGNEFSLQHLNVHEVSFRGNVASYQFVVTYGLHCFTKDESPHVIAYQYRDGREARSVCLERYEASKSLPAIIAGLMDRLLFQTAGEKYFTLELLNSATGTMEPFKVCLAVFKENRLLRIHVTSAFFARWGAGSPGEAIPHKSYSIFKVAKDVQEKPRAKFIPKEANNRRK